MDLLKFRLSGKTGFFKKPDVNTYNYFTYGHIHKIALLGILGSVIGLNGYTQQNEDDLYPEFYDKLKDLKIGIGPLNDKGYIPKKINIYNNSVGFASKEPGNNLIIKEQWLENPAWDIYIEVSNDESLKIKDYILNQKSIYTPYLGKNDHIADISDVEFFRDVKTSNDVKTIHSLFPKKECEIDISNIEKQHFEYTEYLPISLSESLNQYNLEPFIYTNMDIKKISFEVYNAGDKNIVLF